jgi:hypothetical protein
LGNKNGSPKIDYTKNSPNRQANGPDCLKADKIFGGTNLNQVYVRNSKTSMMYEASTDINKSTYTTPGNIFTQWGKLNIRSIRSMSISFIIRMDYESTGYRNILQITNSGSNTFNQGDRVPSIWIGPTPCPDPMNPNNSLPSTATSNGINTKLFYLIICVDTQKRANATYTIKKPLKLNNITRVDIVFNNQIEIFFTETLLGNWDTTSLVDTCILDDDIIEPLPMANIYVSAPITFQFDNKSTTDTTGGGFDLNNLVFMDTSSNMVCAKISESNAIFDSLCFHSIDNIF